MTTYQGINESPLTFHTRIRHMVGLAGYDDAVKEQVIEQTFMNGIHKELAIQVRSSPITLTHTQKVDYAQRYWAARNPGQDVMQQVLPTALQNSVVPDNAATTYPAATTNPTPMAQAIRPATVNWDKPKEDSAIDDLVEQMSRMTAHIADLDKRLEASKTPVQRFTANSRSPPRPCPSCRGNHWYQDCPNRNEAPKCYRCQKPGHRSTECNEPDTRICGRCGEIGHIAARCLAETSRVIPKQNRNQANVVQFGHNDYYDYDDEWEEFFEAYPATSGRRSGRPRRDPTPYERPKKILKKDQASEPPPSTPEPAPQASVPPSQVTAPIPREDAEFKRPSGRWSRKIIENSTTIFPCQKAARNGSCARVRNTISTWKEAPRNRNFRIRRRPFATSSHASTNPKCPSTDLPGLGSCRS
jgi:Zinc knuckle